MDIIEILSLFQLSYGHLQINPCFLNLLILFFLPLLPLILLMQILSMSMTVIDVTCDTLKLS